MPEVHQQGQFAARGTEIVQDLCAVFINQRRHRLDLNDDFVIAKEIRRERLEKRTPAMLQSLQWFREKWNALGFELNFQTFVIYRFEKTAALIFVDSKAGADDGV